jgi:hypothetical protein
MPPPLKVTVHTGRPLIRGRGHPRALGRGGQHRDVVPVRRHSGHHILAGQLVAPKVVRGIHVGQHEHTRHRESAISAGIAGREVTGASADVDDVE